MLHRLYHSLFRPPECAVCRAHAERAFLSGEWRKS